MMAEKSHSSRYNNKSISTKRWIRKYSRVFDKQLEWSNSTL